MPSIVALTDEERLAYFEKIGMAEGFAERMAEMKQDKARVDAEDEEDEQIMLNMERTYLP